jgi:TPR repeat protein
MTDFYTPITTRIQQIALWLIISIGFALSPFAAAEGISLDEQKAALAEAHVQYQNNRYFDALDVIRPAAESGYAPAQHFYAYLNWGGSFYDEAYLWHEKAAMQGHRDSIFSLVSLIVDNEVMDKNTQIAVDWLVPLAQQGDSHALELLFKLNHDGRPDWPINANQALQWLTNGLQAQQPWAMFAWSGILENGDLKQSKNLQQALYWLTQAGEQGYLPAIDKLIEVYSTPLLSQKVDQSQIRYWSSK